MLAVLMALQLFRKPFYGYEKTGVFIKISKNHTRFECDKWRNICMFSSFIILKELQLIRLRNLKSEVEFTRIEW